MKFLVTCITAFGVLLAAFVALAAPSNNTDNLDVQEVEAEKQRGFKIFKDYFSVAFNLAADSPRRKDFNITLTGIFNRSDLTEGAPVEHIFMGTRSIGDETPEDMWEVHASSAHLQKSPHEYLQYTAAQVVCRMVKRLKDGTSEERDRVDRCACETVGRKQCIDVHHHIAQLQGHVPRFRSLDELAVYMQTMENEVKERYGITTFERP